MNKNSNPVVAALPGDGWEVECISSDGVVNVWPVVTLLVHADGDVVPSVLDMDGEVLPQPLGRDADGWSSVLRRADTPKES